MPKVNKNKKPIGGAEKVRIKKQIMLQNEAKSCSNILSMFSKSKVRIYFILLSYLVQFFLHIVIFYTVCLALHKI